MWIKTLGGGLLGTIISGCKFLTVLCLVLRYMRKTIRELMKKAGARTAYLLLQKQKVGDVVGIPIMYFHSLEKFHRNSTWKNSIY